MRDNPSRLKWFNCPDGMIKSERVFAGCEIMRAIINPKLFTLEIKDADKEETTFAAGSADTILKLKTLAKSHLSDMRAKFVGEIRPRKLSKAKKKA